MSQMSIWDRAQECFKDWDKEEAVRFDGKTYDPAQDHDRLKGQLGRVWAILKGGGWWTISQIREESFTRFDAVDSEAGISARIRDLRKPRFGGYEVERRRSQNSSGLWQYRLSPPAGSGS